MKGYATESKYCHERITYVYPTRHDYSDKHHPNYYKYTCPEEDICDKNDKVVEKIVSLYEY